MSSALLDAPRFALLPSRRSADPAGGAAGRGRPTLEDLLAGTLHTARTREEADCPVCHGPMHVVDGGARCDSCGSTLS